MKIVKVEIKNFRSIKELCFEPSPLCAIIGPNSSGKTNVLRALNILLGEKYPTERAFRKDDFYNRDSNSQISIQIWFSSPLPAVKLTPKGSGEKQFVEAISLKLEHTKDPNSSFPTVFTAIAADGREFYGSGAVREKVSFVYLPSERELSKQFNTSQWTLLGKILKEVDTNFRNSDPESSDDPDVVQSFIDAMATPRSILESDFSTGLTFSKFKDTFIEYGNKLASGLTQDIGVEMEIYDPLYYFKTVVLMGYDGGQPFNIEELGSGVQNLILLALLQTYADLMKDSVILAIEEPETYLYPQAQRHLYSIFKDLASEDDSGVATQVFFTTHNPSFVDASRPSDLLLLRKTNVEGTHRCEGQDIELAEDDFYKIYTNFNMERNEVFFANKTLLVEGPSDKIFWSTFLGEKCGIDLDGQGISIIECNGKTGVIYFIGVCRLSGINDYMALWDQDDKEEEIKDEHNNLKYVLDEGMGIEIPGDLEKHLSIEGGNKVKDAYLKAMEMEESDLPKDLAPIVDFVRGS